MAFVQPAGRRSRRPAYVKAGAIATAVVATVAWIVSACNSGTINLCDPANWPDGVQNPTFLDECCNPPGVDSGIPTQPLCPNYGIDAGTDAGDGGDAMADGPIEPPCPGQCLPWLPDPWAPPQLVWLGPEAAAPPCPGTAAFMAYAGAIDLDAGALPCGQCGCAPPDGGCILPTELAANSTACPATAPSNVQTPFDAPAGWDGGCTTVDPIDGGALCNGGQCVGSLTIAAPTVAEPGCTAIQPPTPDAGLSSSYAVACIGQAVGACATGFLCAPVATGFRACVAQQGDDNCPGSPYTEKHLAFVGVDDTRSCSPCTCGAPSGDKCTVELSIYSDSACASTAYTLTVDSTMPEWCVDVTAGPFLSKSASLPTYVPGSCQPAGGAPAGTATATSPTTFCCIASSSGPPAP